MSTSERNTVLERIRRTTFFQLAADHTDGQLLDCYVASGNEAAFEALVRRHGPMVLGVCRRLLLDAHDAEDAFQATFLALVRKAASIVPRERVGSWLYGTACLAARKARATIAKRRGRERQVMTMPEPASIAESLWHDLLPVLDQELAHLPDKLRLPIVLCDLECKTRKEAARQLGWPEGTIAGRLAQGRTLLARRLRKHGLPLSGGMLAALLSQNPVSARLPLALVQATVQAASVFAAGKTIATGMISTPVAALTEGVLKAMLLKKIKIMLAALVLLMLASSGVGLLAHQVLASGPMQAVGEPAAQPEKPKQAASNNTITVKHLVVEAVDAARNTISVVSASRQSIGLISKA